MECEGRSFDGVYPRNTYDGILDVSFSPLVDVLDPPVVRIDTVGRQPNDLDIALREIGLMDRDFRKLGSAHRGEVIGVRKKDGLALTIDFGERQSEERDIQAGTQESPIHSWNLIGPLEVSASKSGAMLPRRRVGILFNQL